MSKKVLTIDITEKMVNEILNELKPPSKFEIGLLGEDWHDGYKSGYFDLLNVLGIKIDDLKN